MPSEFERLTGIVDAYLEENPMILEHPNVHGVLVRHNADWTMDLVIQTDLGERIGALQAQVDAHGAFTITDEPYLNPRPQVLYAPRATCAKAGTAPASSCRQAAGARGGSPIANDKARGNGGTAGWIFELNAQLVCLGNAHVLATDNPAEVACKVAGVRATLRDQVKPIANSNDNSWDYAIAILEKDQTAVGEMCEKKCDIIPRHDYPRKLSDDVSLYTRYWKVGNTTGCTHGPLVYTGRKWIGEFEDPTKHPAGTLPPVPGFKGVLGFDLRAEFGDSGSVIIREDDNSVLGLLFAIDPGGTMAWANPLFRAGWTKIDGERPVGCGTVPRFTSPNLVMYPQDLP